MDGGRVPYTEAERLALRTHIMLAGETIGSYWPMRTFIHHNPLHGLEYLTFEQAIQRGQQFLGARGYLPNDVYREFYREGRIGPAHVDAVLAPLAQDPPLTIGARPVTHLEVLRAQLVQGILAPTADCVEALVAGSSDQGLLTALAGRLQEVLPQRSAESEVQEVVNQDLSGLGRRFTLSEWCDRTLGTALTAQINTELVKWCSAFLDEGQATWPMPHRESTLYGAWKELAQQEPNGLLWGIADWKGKVAALPDRPEDAILESLAALGLPQEMWQEYFSLHLAALYGWSAFITWRSGQPGYPWQEAYPASVVKYLAVRLFYERELVAGQCRRALGTEGTMAAIENYMQWHPLPYFLRRSRVAGHLPIGCGPKVDRLCARDAAVDQAEWESLAQQYLRETSETFLRVASLQAAWRLTALVKVLGLDPAGLTAMPPSALHRLLTWLEAFPEQHHGPRWLEALEGSWRARLLGQLMRNVDTAASEGESQLAHDTNREKEMRPQAQAVFCIDVRSEVYRRYLEAVGNYETFGFAGFFICFIRYRGFGSNHETDQFPVIMKARNFVREIPRSYQGDAILRHRAGAQFLRQAHTLLHDLKENVMTPFVMVESLGWFYSFPFLGKTLTPLWFRSAGHWLKRLVAPLVSTTLTVDKLSKSEAEEMVASEQRAAIRQALRTRLGLPASSITAELVEMLRVRALGEDGVGEPIVGEPLRIPGLSPDEETAFIGDLRLFYRIDRRWAAAEKERITRTGFTFDEQVFTVETALKMMGLTRNFARLVLFCAHGSTSDNNPFESALDCGACGGNRGNPNARLLAAMANKPQVRERLAKTGVVIPPDTHFLGTSIDTTTDEVELFDLEDVPPTHRRDLTRLMEDLKEASRHTSQERIAHFPDVAGPLLSKDPTRKVLRRSADWSQVRPEWGLSRNAAFIIARREITKGVNLEGRVFLHSYDYLEDPNSKMLEILLTAPQVVTQWINMEHYFSTVHNEVYGSSSKIYHNVVGRLGVMFGTQSDLRTGLPWQTVMEGERPYHEPMRLLTVVEAPRERLEGLIRHHEVLHRYYHKGWVHLVVFEREENAWYRYRPSRDWQRIHVESTPRTEAEGVSLWQD